MTADWLWLVEKVNKVGLKSKPEVGIQFGARGATTAKELEAEGIRDPGWAREKYTHRQKSLKLISTCIVLFPISVRSYYLIRFFSRS